MKSKNALVALIVVIWMLGYWFLAFPVAEKILDDSFQEVAPNYLSLSHRFLFDEKLKYRRSGAKEEIDIFNMPFGPTKFFVYDDGSLTSASIWKRGVERFTLNLGSKGWHLYPSNKPASLEDFPVHTSDARMYLQLARELAKKKAARSFHIPSALAVSCLCILYILLLPFVIFEIGRWKKGVNLRIAKKLHSMVDTGFSGVTDGSIAQFVIDVLDGGHLETVIRLYREQAASVGWHYGFAKKVTEATGIALHGKLGAKDGDSMSIYQFVSTVTHSNQWDKIQKLIADERANIIFRLWKKLWRLIRS